jgi:hypothetical protein
LNVQTNPIIREFRGGPLAGEMCIVDEDDVLVIYPIPEHQCNGAAEYAGYWLNGEEMVFASRCYDKSLAHAQAEYQRRMAEIPPRPKARRKLGGTESKP